MKTQFTEKQKFTQWWLWLILISIGIIPIIGIYKQIILGKPFGVIPQLLAIAEDITKLHAICIDCGDIANYTFRKLANKKIIQIGDGDSYKALCRSCYLINTKS